MNEMTEMKRSKILSLVFPVLLAGVFSAACAGAGSWAGIEIPPGAAGVTFAVQ